MVRNPLPTSFNRGMRLEAIAALLGHQKMEMTLIYARIAIRVVADEYAAVSAKIDALYGQPPALPADYETTGMARLRREAHARMLGNGLCTRPAELDCRLESACETCAYFRTGTDFLADGFGPVFARRGRRALKDQATRDHRGYNEGIAGDDREPRRRASKAVARRCHVQVLQSLLRLDVPIDKCPLEGHDEGEVTEPGSCRCVPIAVLVQELLDPGRPPADSQEDSSEP